MLQVQGGKTMIVSRKNLIETKGYGINIPLEVEELFKDDDILIQFIVENLLKNKDKNLTPSEE